MAESKNHKQLMFEIMNRKKLDSESVQQFEEEEEPASPEKDPGVLNTPVTEDAPEPAQERQRRARSQPGPVSGSLLTATAARARRRPQKNVMYAEPERPDVVDKQSPKFLAVFRPEDADSVSVGPGDSASPLPYNGNYRNHGDARSLRSLNSYRQYASNNDMRGVGTPRKRSVVTMDAQSFRSVETHAPPPTSPEKNNQLTVENVTISLSCMYAIFIITVGVVIYFADLFMQEIEIAPIYSIILSVTGFIYMLFLLIDINRYKSIVMENQKIRSLHEENLESYFRKQEIEYGQMTPGDRTPDTLRSSTFPGPQLVPQRHDYCFSQGRHSGSFYLKMGAAAFALGHLVHSVLLIVVQIALVTDENVDNDDCVDNFQVVLDFINPLFCFFQLFFIFKYSNVIILNREGLARFAFMHFIGTSLCFWVSAIIRETVLGLSRYAQSVYGNGYGETNYTRAVSRAQNRLFDVSGLYDENCVGSDAISTIYENFSPYLYPFSVEFNILVVAVYYIIWSNIGNCENDKCKEDDDDVDSSSFDTHTVCNRIPTASEDNDFSSNIVIYADCHASNRGLFMGMTLLVLVVGMLILGFVFSSVGEEFHEVGYLVSNCTRLFIHTCLLLSAVIAFNQTKKMDINEHPVSLLDDILLFICLPAFFMETVLSMVATISILNVVNTIDFVVMVIQVVIQTALIADGLRRCSNTKKLRRSKPGREVIMFLIIANVAMWLFNTFSFKSPESLDERYAFYGKVVWSILGHISLPLIMFYRFHSSVCFADIWDSAYKPGSEH